MHGNPKVLKVIQSSKVRVDVGVVRYIISEVLVSRREDRIQIDHTGVEVIVDILQVVMDTCNNSYSTICKLKVTETS